jgi:hypothetical protein
MKFTIKGTSQFIDATDCIDENGKVWRLDLTCDASFPEIINSEEYKTATGMKELMERLKGKTFECEDITPYIPCYFVRNAKFI